jgi:hypothetical protein
LVLIVLALQMVYKLNGYKLLRASQQATQGEALSFIEANQEI